MIGRHCRIALLMALLAPPAPAEVLDYDLRYGPLLVGRLTLETSTVKGAYRARALIRSAGLAGVVRAVHFLSEAGGQPGDPPRPQWYDEQADTGRRVSRARLRWHEGGPKVLTYRASPEEQVPPASDVPPDALDPASALMLALSGRVVCDLSLQVFDGQRLNAVVLDRGRVDQDRMTCAGRLVRLAGYRPDDMAERRQFALQLSYSRSRTGYVLAEAEVQTLYGKVRLKRR